MTAFGLNTRAQGIPLGPESTPGHHQPPLPAASLPAHRHFEPLSSPLLERTLLASWATCSSCYSPVIDFVLGFLTTQSNFPALISFSALGI